MRRCRAPESLQGFWGIGRRKTQMTAEYCSRVQGVSGQANTASTPTCLSISAYLNIHLSGCLGHLPQGNEQQTIHKPFRRRKL